MDLSEVPLPVMFFRQVAGMSQYEIEELGKKYDFARANDAGVPAGGIIKALNTERKKVSDIMGTKINQTDVEIKVELALKQENVLAKQINNQAKLALLIPKEEASDRVKKVLRAVISLIKNGIKNAAPRLVELQEKRDIETIITEEWNEAVELLEKEAKVISWEHDGSGQLLATKLKMLENSGDEEFVDIFKKRVDDVQKCQD